MATEYGQATLKGRRPRNEDAALVISGISVSDPDAAGADIQLTLSVNQGTLTVNDAVPSGLQAGDISGNGSNSVVLTGTTSEINATLADLTGLTYQGNANFNGSDSLTITADDLGNTGAGGAQTDQAVVAITVNAVNDAPVNQVPATIFSGPWRCFS